MKSFLYKTLFIILSSCCFTACEDDDLCSQELLVFMRQWSGPMNIQRTYSTDGVPVVNGGKTLKFPVYLTREATVEVDVTVGVNENLITSYNEAHQTDYNLLPIESLKILNQNVVVPAGCLQSPDSVKLDFDYEKLNPGKYILPLTVSSVTSKDKGIRASSTAATVFYEFTVTLDNLNNLNVGVEGTKVDRSNWKISSNDDLNDGYPITNLIDGDLKTDWRGTKRVQGIIVVDMGQEHALKGLSYYHSGTHYDAPVSFRVSTSVDGEKWVTQGDAGRYSFSSSIKEKEYGMNFFVPITCRYFKVQVIAVYYNNYYGARFGELDALK